MLLSCSVQAMPLSLPLSSAVVFVAAPSLFLFGLDRAKPVSVWFGQGTLFGLLGITLSHFVVGLVSSAPSCLGCGGWAGAVCVTSTNCIVCQVWDLCNLHTLESALHTGMPLWCRLDSLALFVPAFSVSHALLHIHGCHQVSACAVAMYAP
jgi:hypothetical protein